jgi:hypothetical protein
MEVDSYLEACYRKAVAIASESDGLEKYFTRYPFLEAIVNQVENCKGVLTVITTSLVYKIYHPEQDVRNHQVSIKGGYSGRVFDTHHITPFFQSKGWPAMKESGWLTRSLEQKVPYDRDYPGAIRPIQIKESFLDAMEWIENANIDDQRDLLLSIFVCLAKLQEGKELALAMPINLSIQQILSVVEMHCSHKYDGRGGSRLPVIALYSIYQIIVEEFERYEGLTLLPLESHSSADARSGMGGDINVVNDEGDVVEAVEVKMGIPVDENLVMAISQKILSMKINRYYILTTAPHREEHSEKIDQLLHGVRSTNGCQVIVNGVFDTLRYYLRLIKSPAHFVEKYVENLKTDGDVRYEFKVVWNELVSEITI